MAIVFRFHFICALGITVFISESYGSDISNQLVSNQSSTMGNTMGKMYKFIRDIENSEEVKNNVTASCRQHVHRTILGLVTFQPWALRMADVAGKEGSDMLNLPIRWLGSKDGCESITAEDKVTKEVFYHGKYCRLDAPLPNLTTESLLSTVMFGLCVPDMCTEADAHVYIMATIEHWTRTIPLTDIKVKCFERRSVGADFVSVASIIGIIISMTVIGTLYDIVCVRLRLCRSGLTLKSDNVLNSFRNLFMSKSVIPYNHTDDTNAVSHDVSYVNGDKVVIKRSGKSVDGCDNKSNNETLHTVDISGKDTLFLVDNEIVCNEEAKGGSGSLENTGTSADDLKNNGVTAVTGGNSILDKMRTDLAHEANTCTDDECGGNTVTRRITAVLRSFSLLVNIPKVLCSKQDEDYIEHVHGIRVLSMAWIVLGQTLLMSYKYADNPLQYLKESKKQLSFMALEGSVNAIDTFFVISGMLLAYHTLKGLDKGMGDKKLNLLYFYLHKLWRFTPTYLIVLTIGTVILPHFLTSPLSNGTLASMESCKTNWWKHLLYINNYAEQAETACMHWTWYLACSMQFFMISPFLLVLLHKHNRVGLVVCGIMVLLTVILRAIISNHFTFGISFLSLEENGFLDQFEYNMMFPAHTRLASFVMGILIGYMIWKWKRHFECPKGFVIAGWILSFALACVTVYGCHYYHKSGTSPPQAVADLFNALQTTVWSLSVCWIVFACSTNNGGWINKLLSWGLFVPLSRLTFCVFLIHPLVISLYYENKQNVITLTHYELVYTFLGNLVTSYMGAFVISLLFEVPFRSLEKKLYYR